MTVSPTDSSSAEGLAPSFPETRSKSVPSSVWAVSYTHLDVYKRQVLIISAGALAFVVLYNLTNINITEREKEIATIKVLGFYDKEVSSYIYRETAALTIIGTAVGLVLGIFLHQFVIRTADVYKRQALSYGMFCSWKEYFLSPGCGNLLFPRI